VLETPHVGVRGMPFPYVTVPRARVDIIDLVRGEVQGNKICQI
jgi:hypothetical protein